MADDLEITAIDKLAVLRAAYDADEIIVGKLAQKNVNVDIILQSTGRDGKKDIIFTLSLIHI